MSNIQRNSSFLSQLRMWLGIPSMYSLCDRHAGQVGIINNGRYKNALKRKLLRHEPLEDRHLLAVDLAGGMSGALFPQEELAVISASQASSQLTSEIASNVENFALIPNNIAEQEANSAAQDEAENNISTNAAPLEQTSFDCIATVTSATSHVVHTTVPRREEMAGFREPKFASGMFDPDWAITEITLYNQSRTRADAPLTEETSTEFFPTPRTHGKIVPLEFDKPSVVDNDGGVMMSVTSGGQSGGNPNHNEHGSCNNAPHFYGGLNDGQKTMMLTSETSYSIGFSGGDRDEYLYGVDEKLELKMSGISGTSNFYISESEYCFSLNIDISEPGEIIGEVWFVDIHGSSSSKIPIHIEVIEITGFKYTEKAPGEADYDDLEDPYIVWAENPSRFEFTTEDRQLDYDDPTEMTKFADIQDNRITYKKWGYNSSTGTYTEPSSTAQWSTTQSGSGLYTVKVEIYMEGNLGNRAAKIGEFTEIYCFNAINSVYWETADSTTNAIQLGDNPPANGGGKRCFPEQSEPGDDAEVHDEILVMVDLAVAIPAGLTGTVHIDWFDSDNPVGSTKTPTHNGPGERDNHGDFNMEDTTLTFGAGDRQEWTTCTISPAHAGDNYIIAAHPNEGVISRASIDASNDIAVPVPIPASSSGGSSSGGSGGTSSGGSGGMSYVPLKKSTMLTVWRTLNVECDAMYIPSGVDDGGIPLPYQDGDRLAHIPEIGEMAINAFADACILPSVYEQPVSSKYIPGYDELPVTYNSLGEEGDIFTIGDEAVDVFDEYRFLPESSPYFWTIHAIGAFDLLNNSDGIMGYAPDQLHSTILLFGDLIESERNDYVNERPGRILPLSTVIQWITLHEIGHTFLGPGHTGDGSVMMSANPVPMCAVAENQQFSDEQIKTIQSKNSPT